MKHLTLLACLVLMLNTTAVQATEKPEDFAVHFTVQTAPHASLQRLLIRPDLSVIHAAYFTRASWKNFLTRSGDFSNDCMCSVAAAFNLALVRTGTLV